MVNNLPVKSRSRGIMPTHTRRIMTRNGPRTIVINKGVKKPTPKKVIRSNWQDVLRVDDGTNYPVKKHFEMVNNGKLFSHYGKGISISNASDVARLVRSQSDMDKEFFMVLGLSTKNTVVYKEIVSMGTLNSTLVHPREIFKKAILNSCNAIILAHNHPSGDLEPSSEDDVVTKEISVAGKYLGITLLDHVIVGPVSGFYSFSNSGRLEELKNGR